MRFNYVKDYIMLVVDNYNLLYIPLSRKTIFEVYSAITNTGQFSVEDKYDLVFTNTSVTVAVDNEGFFSYTCSYGTVERNHSGDSRYTLSRI